MDFVSEGFRDVQQRFEFLLTVRTDWIACCVVMAPASQLYDEPVDVAVRAGRVLQIIDRILREEYTQPSDAPVFERQINIGVGGLLVQRRVVGLPLVFEMDLEGVVENAGRHLYIAGKTRFVVTVHDDVGGDLVYRQAQFVDCTLIEASVRS